MRPGEEFGNEGMEMSPGEGVPHEAVNPEELPRADRECPPAASHRSTVDSYVGFEPRQTTRAGSSGVRSARSPTTPSRGFRVGPTCWPRPASAQPSRTSTSQRQPVPLIGNKNLTSGPVAAPACRPAGRQYNRLSAPRVEIVRTA